jgi:hypothetical protein
VCVYRRGGNDWGAGVERVKFSAQAKKAVRVARRVCRLVSTGTKRARSRGAEKAGERLNSEPSIQAAGRQRCRMRGRRVDVAVGQRREVASGGCGRAIGRPAETSESTSESLHAQNELAAGGFLGRNGDPGVERASTARMRVS